MGILDKIAAAVQKVKIASAVGKVVLTGKNSKVLERLDKGSEAALKALEMLSLAKELIKK